MDSWYMIACLATLTGCSPYWTTDMPGYRVQRIDIQQTADWQTRCQRTGILGCAVRIKEGARTIFYVKPGLSDADGGGVLQHEAKHAAGRVHDDREVFSLDCSCQL